MTLLFAGYFPKRIRARDEWLKASQVREIWSVSDCISKAPEACLTDGRQNDLGLFDTQELAKSLIPPDERESFAILAYRVLDRMFDEGKEVELDEPVPPVPGPGPGFDAIGFDAVGRSMHSFGCSPLSCNGGAETFPTNERCLFRTLDEAIAGAKVFSSGGWEPGPYWVVEVLAEGGPMGRSRAEGEGDP